MGVEENVKVAEAFEEAFNARDWEGLGSTLADSVVAYDSAESQPLRGRYAVLGMLQRSAQFFPTARIEGVHRFGQADWVCVENVETGARKDSEKRYRIRTCYMFRVRGGELLESRFYYDALDMMTQMSISLSGD